MARLPQFLKTIAVSYVDSTFNYLRHVSQHQACSMLTRSGTQCAHAINYENIGQTLFRRTRPSILERTLPAATCIKFKVFTAIFSLHFTQIVFRLFACSLARTFTLPCTVSYSNSQEQATHTHTQTYCGKCIVCF